MIKIDTTKASGSTLDAGLTGEKGNRHMSTIARVYRLAKRENCRYKICKQFINTTRKHLHCLPILASSFYSSLSLSFASSLRILPLIPPSPSPLPLYHSFSLPAFISHTFGKKVIGLYLEVLTALVQKTTRFPDEKIFGKNDGADTKNSSSKLKIEEARGREGEGR